MTEHPDNSASAPSSTGAETPPELPKVTLQYSNDRRGMSAQSIIAFILGISAIPLVPFACAGVLFGFVAIFVGIGALDAIKTDRQLRGKVLAIIGIAGGVLAILLALFMLILLQNNRF
jgi:hypothetical protein